jgi:hypothetical protein
MVNFLMVFYSMLYMLVIFVANRMLSRIYLDLVHHVYAFSKYNKLVLILFEKQT